MTDSLAPAATLTPLTPGTWTIDPAHTEVGFVTKHAMVTKVRGYFRDVAGEVVVADNLADSTATATIQAGSVQTGNADRDNHLHTSDFFEVEKYPTITFESTGLRNINGDEFVLDGNLTIKGITQPVSLDVEFGGVAKDPFGNERAGFSAETDVEREQWGLNFNAALETGGFLVSKKVKLVLDVSLIKQA